MSAPACRPCPDQAAVAEQPGPLGALPPPGTAQPGVRTRAAPPAARLLKSHAGWPPALPPLRPDHHSGGFSHGGRENTQRLEPGDRRHWRQREDAEIAEKNRRSGLKRTSASSQRSPDEWVSQSPEGSSFGFHGNVQTIGAGREGTIPYFRRGGRKEQGRRHRPPDGSACRI